MFRRKTLEERMALAVVKQLEQTVPGLRPDRIRHWEISTDGDEIHISLTMRTGKPYAQHIIQGGSQDA